MKQKKYDVALLVHSCDRYELLYRGFEYFFSKYWNPDINCRLYFATENKQVAIDNFENIQSGNGEWTDRLAMLLKNKITEPYILYVQEDMWFDKKINPDFFNTLFELAVQNDWQQVKLHSSDVYKTTATDIFIEGFNVGKVDNEKSDYLMSHQITLWNKNFLLKQLHKNEHPWRNERKGTQRLKKLNPVIYQIDYFAENGQPEINKNNNPVLRSQYHTISVNGVLDAAALPFIATLASTDLKEYAQKLDHNYSNELTHDGRSKPRKVDIFKRIKNFIAETFRH